MPSLKTLAVLVGGLLLGLLWAYALAPTVYYNSDPRTLHQSWQDEWVKLLADRYALPTNTDISANIIDLLGRVDDPVGIVDRLIAQPGEEANLGKLQAIRPLAEQAEPIAVAAPEPKALSAISCRSSSRRLSSSSSARLWRSSGACSFTLTCSSRCCGGGAASRSARKSCRSAKRAPKPPS